jgi:hypothetical protein
MIVLSQRHLKSSGLFREVEKYVFALNVLDSDNHPVILFFFGRHGFPNLERRNSHLKKTDFWFLGKRLPETIELRNELS